MVVVRCLSGEEIGERIEMKEERGKEKSLLDDFDVSVREDGPHGLWRDEDELSSPRLSCCGDLRIQSGGVSKWVFDARGKGAYHHFHAHVAIDAVHKDVAKNGL